jgi:DNA-binding transcriptional regulator GbsR (MarR family)
MMGRMALDFVERMGGALTDAGLPRLPSRVFAALLVDDDGRMTSVELAAALGVSAGGVSGAVNYLAQIRMLRRERERGSRRDVYVVDDDAWHEAMMRKEQTYAPMLAALAAAEESLGPGHPARRRLVLTREFLVFMDREMDSLAERWNERRAEIESSL